MLKTEPTKEHTQWRMEMLKETVESDNLILSALSSSSSVNREATHVHQDPPLNSEYDNIPCLFIALLTPSSIANLITFPCSSFIENLLIKHLTSAQDFT